MEGLGEGARFKFIANNLPVYEIYNSLIIILFCLEMVAQLQTHFFFFWIRLINLVFMFSGCQIVVNAFF